MIWTSFRATKRFLIHDLFLLIAREKWARKFRACGCNSKNEHIRSSQRVDVILPLHALSDEIDLFTLDS